MTIAVAPLADSDGELAFDIWRLSSLHDLPDFPETTRAWFFHALHHDRPGRRTERFLARLDGRPAGYGQLHLPQDDNPELCTVDLFVHPELRRRGVGRALHAHLSGRARADGRRVMVGVSIARELPGGGGAPHDGAGPGFAEAMGAEAALPEIRHRLDVTALDRPRLDRMLAGARTAAAGYRVVFWEDRAPDAYVDDVAYLEGRLLSDAPMGDLEVEPERPDAARIREIEADQRSRGRTAWHAGAVHEESGRLVAWTTLVQDGGRDWHCWQGITLVDPPHRGRRLGLLVKIENLLRFVAAHPALTAVDTWNAAANTHMIAINVAMGYRPVDGFVQWQLKLT
ncbi:GNAT family N-acetyltransferase [Spirilliplanes yamanashiensis]|uniref:GNAT family N-acetyltransferase n=2 Tax=Spirilliplanes yamanashiensis TaxID=42233 RepID=A0A8J3Y6C4_9ACTN|nr:GNAT family N-acetyltransferase [Spirilliplanes yamanashiensis]MDP9814486.1 GNAT superfamily N-acetyltransferase [Spirilliplanes yamanashiensis]GIJ02138.1 GNAT family N-acetyltransferase [Spirilliplanes yamanashiensis]